MRWPGSLLSISRMFAVVVCAGAATAYARGPNLAKYPLRVHVLATDETYRSARMSPGEAVACDSIEDMVGAIDPNPGMVTIAAFSGDPCGLNADSVGGGLLNIQREQSFSGTGRGDLVMPPDKTQGFSFKYDDCFRVRVLPGFQSLPARWKKPGQELEVLVPSDDIPDNGEPLPPAKCRLTVKLRDTVYLLLPNKKLVEVSQQDYWKKPALRLLLSGGKEPALSRPAVLNVSSHPNQ